MDIHQLSDIQKDVLREIGNIGAGNAVSSLSTMLQRKIDMEVPSIRLVTIDEMIEIIGGPDRVIMAIIFRVEGKAPGTVYFIMSLKEAEILVQEILKDHITVFDENNQIRELASSVLQEVGNILTGSYLSALSDFTNINMRPSIPYLGIDMAGAIVVDGLLGLSEVIDYALIIDTKINSGDSMNGMNGQFFFMPDSESFAKIFRSLGFYANE